MAKGGGKEGQMDVWKFPLLSSKTMTLWGQTALELMGVMGINQYSQGVQTRDVEAIDRFQLRGWDSY